MKDLWISIGTIALAGFNLVIAFEGYAKGAISSLGRRSSNIIFLRDQPGLFYFTFLVDVLLGSFFLFMALRFL